MFWPNIPEYAAEAQAKLSAWDGCVWRLEAYGMSHASFLLWVYAEGRLTSLHVSCLSPHYICGPLGWNGCRFTVRAQDSEPLGFVVVRDEIANFEIRCQHVQITEGPPPHWLQASPKQPQSGG